MKKLKNLSTLMVDCDSTLVTWNLPEHYCEKDLVIIECNGKEKACVIYQSNVQLLKEFACTNCEIVVWSASGADWAEAVVKALELENYVSVVMSKPSFYIDDKVCEKWMGKRIYYNLNGELEHDGY